ncbi:hypothetical protein ACWCQM_13445 [Streptomyces sp. NPDC002125]
MLTTQAARTASFTQTLTFTSASGDTVRTSSGRLDFPGGRAVGSSDWVLAEDLPEEARDVLLGVRLGTGRAPARTQVAVEPDTIRLRAGEAGYWLRYEGSFDAFGTGAAVDALRGSEAAFGGTLLEVLSGGAQTGHRPGRALRGASTRAGRPVEFGIRRKEAGRASGASCPAHVR